MGKNSILQLRAFVIELTDKKLIGKLGTCKTELRLIVGVHLTEPVLETLDKDPSAMRTFSLPEHGE